MNRTGCKDLLRQSETVRNPWLQFYNPANMSRKFLNIKPNFSTSARQEMSIQYQKAVASPVLNVAVLLRQKIEPEEVKLVEGQPALKMFKDRPQLLRAQLRERRHRVVDILKR